MKFHRFIIKNADFSQSPFSLADTELIHQILNVLKLGVGEECMLSDGARNDVRCRIVSLSKKECVCEIIEKTYNANETGTHGVLYCSLLKKELFELVVQKATEVGISEIVPITSRRTVRLGLPSGDRLTRIMKEASEQSGRGVVPILCDTYSFEDAILRAADSNNVTFFYHPAGALFSDWKKENIIPKQANIFIGPEGGWDNDEIHAAQEKNFSIISLGATILRAETAAIIGSYLAIH
ncbi:MAG: RsmE family RNA methyltransferase [Patescibacteria group bacterium]